MAEILEAAFSIVNLPYTVMLIVMVVFWCVTILGLIDLDAFNIDLGTDFDAAADGDLPGLSGQSLLGFLHVGEIPVMFYASIVVLSMWITSMQLNYYLQNESVGMALLLAVPNLILGILVASAVTLPLNWIRTRSQPEISLVGKLCLVKTSHVDDAFGECELATGEAPLLLMARTRNGEVLSKGEAAVIVDWNKQNNLYIVTKHYQET